jgi:hypothetical protein
VIKAVSAAPGGPAGDQLAATLQLPPAVLVHVNVAPKLKLAQSQANNSATRKGLTLFLIAFRGCVYLPNSYEPIQVKLMMMRIRNLYKTRRLAPYAFRKTTAWRADKSAIGQRGFTMDSNHSLSSIVAIRRRK